MKDEREANVIDKDGNFLFEHKRRDDTEVRDAWMDELEETAAQGGSSGSIRLGKRPAPVAEQPLMTEDRFEYLIGSICSQLKPST